MKERGTPSDRLRVAAALRAGSALVDNAGGRWTVVGATDLRLKDEFGRDLTFSSRTLQCWGLWPPWQAQTRAGDDRS